MPSSKPTVLIVEDERQLADLFAEWLQSEYVVKVAYDGESAIDQLTPDIDVVLLDRRMPGVSGDEVLDEILERELPCSVAMITAVDPDFDIIEMGFDDYMVKPVQRGKLLSVVEDLLTLPNYEKTIQEYYQLAAKKAALEMNKSDAELAESDEYDELVSRFTIVKNEADETVQQLEKDDSIDSLF